MAYSIALNTYSLLSPERANELDAQLNAEDDVCSYVAVHDPKGTGQSFIRVIDETGEEIGRL